MVDFLQNVVPVRARHDKQLVSHNANDNTYNYQYTFMVEIVPICKEDIVVLPFKVSQGMGGVGPLMLVTRVGSSFQLTDPHTEAELDGRRAVLPSSVPLGEHRQDVRRIRRPRHRAGARRGSRPERQVAPGGRAGGARQRFRRERQHHVRAHAFGTPPAGGGHGDGVRPRVSADRRPRAREVPPRFGASRRLTREENRTRRSAGGGARGRQQAVEAAAAGRGGGRRGRAQGCRARGGARGGGRGAVHAGAGGGRGDARAGADFFGTTRWVAAAAAAGRDRTTTTTCPRCRSSPCWTGSASRAARRGTRTSSTTTARTTRTTGTTR